MDINFEKDMLSTSTVVNTIYALRTGDVPEDENALGFDITDIDSLIADPNTLSIASGRFSYFREGIPLNVTCQVEDSCRIQHIRGKWFVPGTIEHASVDDLLEEGTSGFEGSLARLVSSEMNMGHHLQNFSYLTSYSSSVSYKARGALYLTETSPAIVRLKEPTLIDSIVFSTLEKGSNRSRQSPDFLNIQYLDENTGEWVNLMTRYAFYDNFTYNHPELGDITAAEFPDTSKNYSNAWKFDVALDIVDQQITTSAIRLIPTNSDVGYIQGISVYSRSKPNYPESKYASVSHCVVYTSDSYELKLDPYIIPMYSSLFENPDDVVANGGPDIDSTFGLAAMEARMPSKYQVGLAKNWFYSRLKGNSSTLNLVFFEGPMPSLDYLLSAHVFTTIDNIRSLLAALANSSDFTYKELGIENYTMMPDQEYDLVRIGEVSDTKMQLSFHLPNAENTSYPTASGTMNYCLILPSNNSNSVVPNLGLVWAGLASVGSIGSGADIEVSNTEYDARGEGIVISRNLLIDVDFS